MTSKQTLHRFGSTSNNFRTFFFCQMVKLHKL